MEHNTMSEKHDESAHDAQPVVDAAKAPVSSANIAPQEAALTTPTDPSSEEQNHASGLSLFLVILALCLAVFCVALDSTVVATAVPRITDDFHDLQDIGWYGSAYLLPTCAFQLFYGKLFTLFSPKLVFLVALAIFEIGSLVCGVSPNAAALIVGRAIAGLGAAGLFSGALVIVSHSVSVPQRPAYTGIIGMVYGLGSVVGPLIGGAFTTNVTWRWCFYINLPIGGVTAGIILLFLHLKHMKAPNAPSGLMQTLWRLDPIGTAIFVPTVVCLLLALQWGGTVYRWSDGRIIALLVLFSFFFPVFIGVQIWLGEIATVPPRIFKRRTIYSASLLGFMLGSSFILFTYFVPIWFQAIRADNALLSAVHTLPLILSLTVAIIFSGGMTTKIGHYMPFVYGSVVLTSIGAGLIYTWDLNTSVGKWVGYQILLGFGVGMALQLPQIAAQATLPLEDVAVGVAVTFFAQLFGGAIFVSAGNNVLNNRLIEYIGALNIPSIDPQNVVNLGATQLRTAVPDMYVAAAIEAYNMALRKVFEVGLIVSCLTALGAAGMEWKSVKQPENPEGGQDGSAAAAKTADDES